MKIIALPRAQRDLDALLSYLIGTGKIPPDWAKIQIRHSAEEDERNRDDPRGFCHVSPGSPYIFCSQALENLEPESRIGILLHEIGHMAYSAWNGEAAEVDADRFCVEQVPEADFTYQDCSYRDPWGGAETVNAPALERVSSGFVARIGA
jgi:hypothetical protein